MKKVIAILFSLSLVSCATIGRFQMGLTSKSVRKTVALEKSCPIEGVKVLDKVPSSSSIIYKIEACGKTYMYKQTAIDGVTEMKK